MPHRHRNERIEDSSSNKIACSRWRKIASQHAAVLCHQQFGKADVITHLVKYPLEPRGKQDIHEEVRQK